MNVKETLDLLMKRLGNRTDPDLRAACLLEMKIAQESLESSETLPWFVLSEATYAETEAGERRVPLPPDFLRESQEQEFRYYQADGTKKSIVKGDYDRLRSEFEGTSGPPEYYAIRGQYLIVFPTPDAIYKVEFSSYYARQEPPTDTVESVNGWFRNFPDLILARAGFVVASVHLKDPELIQTFSALITEAQRRLFHAEVARDEANRTRTMEDE